MKETAITPEQADVLFLRDTNKFQEYVRMVNDEIIEAKIERRFARITCKTLYVAAVADYFTDAGWDVRRESSSSTGCKDLSFTKKR